MSITPTNYDLQQDSRIDEIQEIITTSYEAEDAIEVSFPLVDRPMNDDEWGALAKAWGSGIISFGQFPYRLIIDDDVDVTNQVRIIPSTDVAEKDSVAVIEGFAHRLIEDKLLRVDAVSARTKYTIALQYDPVRAKETGEAVVLDVFAGSLDQTQGKKYVLIYEGYRDPSTVLSQMTWTPVRSRLAPTITVQRPVHLPDPRHSGLLWGTRCYCSATGEEFYLSHDPDSEYMRWERVMIKPQDIGLTIGGGGYYEPMSSSRAPRGIIGADGLVRLYGGIRRVNGDNFNPGQNSYSMAWLPAAYTPKRQYDFTTPAFTTSDRRPVRVVVHTDGNVRGYPNDPTTVLMLDGVTFPLD